MADEKILKVKKRDGRTVSFDEEKIINAVWNAAQAVGGKDHSLAESLGKEIIEILKSRLKEGEVPTVEQTQDIVEEVLVERGHYKTAKAYILYRKQHEEIRNVKDLFSNIDIIENYINLNDWRIKENANMTYSLQGLNFHLSSVISSHYWLNRIYPKEISDAHVSGDFHIHDLCLLGPYCVGWDLTDILVTGFKGVEGKVECKPAKHFRTILGQIVNFFYTLQGEAAGAQAFSNFDTLLAPFIRYDGLNYEQTKQALQEFIFNVNVPTRVGFQTPFTNVSLDLQVPEFMKDEPAIVGGKAMKETYGDFQKELDIFNQAFAEVMEEGDAKGRVFTFPIPTYNITKDFDWDKPEYNKIWEITAKYGIPYFSNFINTNLKPDDVRSMCCRLRLDKRELKSRGGGLFGANPLTGSIGVVTMNMPKLAFRTKDETEFFAELKRLMGLANKSLETKRKTLEILTDRGLFPYSKFYLRNIKERFGEYWKNHFATIGLVGLNEACLNLIGCTIAEEKGLVFSNKVLDFMRDEMENYQEKTGNIYNLEATPAEGTSYRLARRDRAKNPKILFANTEEVNKGAEPYYTNSSQIPVNYTDDLFEALKLQDELQSKYTGGTVFHMFIGEKKPNIDSVKALIKKVTDNFKIPYFTLTPTFSVCPDHGYIFGEHTFCPKCKEKGEEKTCEVYSRVVGYLRPIKQWNEGKQEEFRERKLYDKGLA
ncbi:ribonucleoside triphosphate reductase [Nanoarchaeota archaeon]